MTLLKDIVLIEKGRKHNLLEEFQEGAIRVFQANDFRNENKPLYTFDHTGVLANDNDILLVWDGSVGQMGFGKNGYVGSTMVKLQVKDQKRFSPFFIYRLLQTKSEYLKRKSTGATIMHVNRKSLEQIQIPDLSISEQTKIAILLSKAEKLITQRKESITLVDIFLKSTFLEFFGDVVYNEKKWNKSELKHYAKIRIGPFGSLLHREDYVQDGVPLVNPSHINDGKIFIESKLTISKEKMKELNAYIMYEGDVVLGRRGEIGRCAVITKKESGYLCGTGSIYIRPSKELNSIFLYSIISSVSMRRVLEKLARGITMKNLNSDIIDNLKVPIPPIELQTRFAKIIEKTEALKSQYQQSLKELENLYGSLSQKAFRGELSFKEEELMIAAEPAVTYSQVHSRIPEKSRGFAKQVLSGKIISMLREKDHFTHIKLQKLQYLAEHYIEEDLNWNYYRLTAGPYDNKYMHTLSARLKQNKWFEEKQFRFYPLGKVEEVDQYYESYFGNKKEKLSKLFSLLINSTERLCEAVATIYAVWNNHIILKQEFNRERIKHDFFEWSNRKASLFSEADFEKALEWMQKHEIVPTGFGHLIKEKRETR